MEKEEKTTYKYEKLMLLALVLFSLLLFCFKLGYMSLWDNDESTYSQISREIISTGDWITMHFRGNNWFCHPPLYFWLSAITGKIFGFNEWAMRIWPALFGIFGVVLTFFWGKALFNARVGFWSGLILATSLQYVGQSRMAVIDTIFCFFLSVSLFAFYRGYQTGKRFYYYLFFASMGLSVLAKGPFGIIFPFLIVIPFLMVTRELKVLKNLPWIGGIAIAAGIGFSWYFVEYMRHGRYFFDTVFVYFTWKRFFMSVQEQTGPPWFYIPVLLAGFLPWSSFLPFSIYHLSQDFKKNGKYRPMLFLFVWIVVTFVFFTLAGTKLVNYILPLFPACALAVALWWEEKKNSTQIFISYGFLILLSILLIISIIMYGELKFPAAYRDISNSMLPVGGLIFIVSAFSMVMNFRNGDNIVRKLLNSPAPLVLVMGLSFVFMFNNIVPKIEDFKPIRPLAEKLGEVLTKEDNLGIYQTPGGFSLIFYTGHSVSTLWNEKELEDFMNSPGKTLCVMKEKYYNQFAGRIKAPFYPLIRQKEIVVVSNEPYPSNKK